jgi:hypothetical protein
MTGNVEVICNSLMRKVVASGVMEGHQDHDCAVRVMREELKLFLLPDTDAAGKYKDERDVVLNGHNMEAAVLGILALNCVARIRSERQAVGA